MYFLGKLFISIKSMGWIIYIINLWVGMCYPCSLHTHTACWLMCEIAPRAICHEGPVSSNCLLSAVVFKNCGLLWNGFLLSTCDQIQCLFIQFIKLNAFFEGDLSIKPHIFWQMLIISDTVVQNSWDSCVFLR